MTRNVIILKYANNKNIIGFIGAMKIQNKKKNLFIIFSYVMLVATIPTAILFSNLIGKNMNKQIQISMEDEAALCAEMIERQYQSDMLLLDGLAVRMASSMKEDLEKGIERLVSTAERYGMKRISYSGADGDTITTDKLSMNLKGIDNFERAIAGETLLTNVVIDEFDGEDVNIYSMPVYDSDTKEIMGVMSLVYHSEVFKELLSVTSFDGEGYTYIIDSKGNVIINTNHHNAIAGLENIIEYIEKNQQNEKTVAEIKSSIANKTKSFFEVHSENGNKLACSMPLSINDWFVVSVVPKDVAENTKNTIMHSVAIYCIGISWIAVFVVLSIHFSQKEKNRLLEEALYIDPITGGRTFAKFCLDCRKRLDEQKEEKAVCLFLDIDNFNLIASLYSNERMNKIINNIYMTIQQYVGDNGIVCRKNTDQFCIMYFYNDMEELESSLARFNQAIHDTKIFDHMLRPTIGIYVVEHYKESIDEMVNKARIAHDTIKQNMESCMSYYDESFRNVLYENTHLEDEMEIALKNHEFQPYIQPKYNAENGKICGGEALIRWITADGRIISPAKFIPLAENNGFIRKLDREVFSMVCTLQKYFVDKGIKPLPISVNVSRQLMYDKSFADDYYNHMKEMGLSHDLIELEITESALFEDMDLFRATLEKLRGYGFRILMDDFGTGYSSLMMLKSVPIDELKLDKSFVDDYSDEKGSSIICCVLDLAKMLELPVVAEGVETEDQYQYLKERGCEVIQGYYFSKPLPAMEFMNKIIDMNNVN